MNIIRLFSATQIMCVACGGLRLRPAGFKGPTAKVRCVSRVCRGAITVHGVVEPKESLPTTSAQERAHGPTVLLTSFDRARLEREAAADAAKARANAVTLARTKERRRLGLCARCGVPSELYHCRVCRPLRVRPAVKGEVPMERILASTAKVFGLEVAQLRVRARPGAGVREEKRPQWAAIYVGCRMGWRPKEVSAWFSYPDGDALPAWWVTDQRISAEREQKTDAEFFGKVQAVLADCHSEESRKVA